MAWGWSSWPLPLASGVGLVLTAAAPGLGRWVSPLGRPPDLGRGVAPLGRSCTVAIWHSQPLPLTSDGTQVTPLVAAPGLWRGLFLLAAALALGVGAWGMT